ncbi:putative extracelular serine carboxypeptidase [Aspergillus undulatus]|uniref:putative extracelular serine carboxypeptidase n=1 Tax=Aspergillus undulatus TaxID=1810928 RepID=UPI003CCDDAD0
MRLTTVLLSVLGTLPVALSASFKEYNFITPIDHFHNETRYEPHTNATFNLRYWFDATHYEPGGPVFVIAAGETSGEDRFEFLSQGIVTQLAETYHGLGVILEHRYYGTSYPDDEDTVTTEGLRFLSTEQSLADHAYFAKHVVFPGLEDQDLTAPGTPWIAYGGSYAGAQVAFLRKVYPDIFWGSVSSSGVTAAIIDYWNYYEPIRTHGPADCIDAIQTITDMIDRILIDRPDEENLHAQLQATYGLSPPLNNTDFVNLLSQPLGSFQSRNWDPETGSYEFRHFCDNITAPAPLYPPTNQTAILPKLVEKAGYNASDATLLASIRNNIGYLNLSNPDQEGTSTASSGNSTGRGLPKNSGTSWNYQVCTEWGYFMPGSSVPSSIRPLISRLIDLEYTSSFCASDFGIPSPPDVQRINKHGGFNFSYPRVAIIGGVADPWRDATPLVTGYEERKSTDEEPFILVSVDADHVWDGIAGAVHHWDQNGLSGEQVEAGERPPRVIEELQGEIVRFVGVWLDDFEGEQDL